MAGMTAFNRITMLNRINPISEEQMRERNRLYASLLPEDRHGLRPRSRTPRSRPRTRTPKTSSPKPKNHKIFHKSRKSRKAK